MLLTILLPLSSGIDAYAEGAASESAPSPANETPSSVKKPEEAPKPATPEQGVKAQAPEPAKPAAAALTPTPAPSPAEPKDAKIESGPAGTKPADNVPAENVKDVTPKVEEVAKPTGVGDKKSEHKDTSAKPPEAKAPEAKEAKANSKPRELGPRLENGGNLAVRSSVVNAVYRISWLGAHIGDFTIRSSITNRQYSLQANADLSVFFGTVTWQGITSSRGLMTANGPVPQDYTFRYATNNRHEAIELRFQQRMVQDIIINPPAHPGARNVPITAAHLQNVVDPLSAIVLLSQARLNRHSGDACNKRIPIFDGRVRYDLVLYSKGTRSIESTGKLHGIAYVCGVRYIPIAGHKAGKHGENDYATGNTGIEVWLVPLPEAGLLVPYYVHVPTPAGTASMVTAKFDVETPSGRHALAD